MTITIKCECGNESTIILKTYEELKVMEENDEEIKRGNDKFDVIKHHDGCNTIGSFVCKQCRKYGYL